MAVGDNLKGVYATQGPAGATAWPVTLTQSAAKTVGTGAAAIAVSTAAVGAGLLKRLVSVTCHLSAAPTSAGSLTVTLNANSGAAYDTLLASQAMVGVTDYVFQPDHDLLLLAGDVIDVAYANPDGRTYGVEITTEAR